MGSLAVGAEELWRLRAWLVHRVVHVDLPAQPIKTLGLPDPLMRQDTRNSEQRLA